MIRVDKSSSEPIYLQIERIIRDAVEQSHFQPGDRIPSETDLAQTHGISRMTVRRAIDNLVQEGILFRQQGKGTFVMRPKMQWPGPSFYSFSKTISPLGYSIKTEMLEFKRTKAPLRVVEDLNLSPNAQAVIIRRLRFIDDEPMAITTSYTFEEYYESLSRLDLVNTPFNEYMEQVSHSVISKSTDYVEATTSRENEAKLLGIATGDSLLLIRGVVFTMGDRPLVSTKDLFRGDVFRIGVSSEQCVELINQISTNTQV